MSAPSKVEQTLQLIAQDSSRSIEQRVRDIAEACRRDTRLTCVKCVGLALGFLAYLSWVLWTVSKVVGAG